MIKVLRKKFILAAMVSILVVLAAIMVFINIVNFKRLTKRADEILSIMEERDGKIQIPLKEEINKRKKPMIKHFSPETPYESRFFTVKLNKNNEVVFCDMRKIAAINEETAAAYAEKISSQSSSRGFADVYRYLKTEKSGETQIIFLDCRQELSTFWSFLFNGIIVSGIGLMAVFILVIIFSRVIFRPVEESYEKQKRFITDASHEIKTPLTIIDANLEVIEMENGTTKWTKSSRNQIKRLTALTRQLTALARLDEEQQELIKERFSLSDAVFESVYPFEALANTEKRQLHLQIKDSLFYEGDEKAIRQMIDILMDNAMKYSIEDTIIQITLYKAGRKNILEVSNEAEGMPTGNLDVIFERFYRLDASRNSEKGGSGIGLSLAKAIVQTHKGKIHAYSSDGRNMKITVTL